MDLRCNLHDPLSRTVAIAPERLAGHKTPRAFRFLVELPRTGSGKIAKRELRRGEADAAT